jgi:hypothetical protein
MTEWSALLASLDTDRAAELLSWVPRSRCVAPGCLVCSH